MKKVLILAAHPDDEVLGCGGSIVRHIRNGDLVDIIFFTNGESSRSFFTKKSETLAIKKRRSSALKVLKLLKINNFLFLNYKDNQMDLISTLEIAQIIEKQIKKNKYQIIYTHSSLDLNVDHRKINESTLVACRPTYNSSVEKVLMYEIPSSTEWGSFAKNNSFSPNIFTNIEETRAVKLLALKLYGSELRDYPHPRTIVSIEALEVLRGSTVGFKFAEAFHLAYQKYDN
jgi:LmbE family N-acetylglucosaminyl deacetylase